MDIAVLIGVYSYPDWSLYLYEPGARSKHRTKFIYYFLGTKCRGGTLAGVVIAVLGYGP